MPIVSARRRPPSPPPGKYQARLIAIDEVPGQFDRPAWRWSYAVTDGEHTGKVAERLTGTDLKAGTKLVEHVEAMYGRALADDEEVDFLALVGQDVELVIVPTGVDGVRISAISPAK
jgi:hypothetical protein